MPCAECGRCCSRLNRSHPSRNRHIQARNTARKYQVPGQTCKHHQQHRQMQPLQERSSCHMNLSEQYYSPKSQQMMHCAHMSDRETQQLLRNSACISLHEASVTHLHVAACLICVCFPAMLSRTLNIPQREASVDVPLYHLQRAKRMVMHVTRQCFGFI